MVGLLRSKRILVSACVLAAATTGCSKKLPKPQERVSASANTPNASAPLRSNPQPEVQEGAHGSRKLKGIDLPVYVDGVQQAVLRYGDLPGLKNVGTESTPSYRLVEYLKTIGVSADRVRALYFYDRTNRIASIEGDELRKEKDRFRFHFSSGTTGIAETGWDTVGLKNTFVVHEIRRFVVFVDKAPPELDAQVKCVLAKPEECSDAVPYATTEPAKGTRVYVDGKLVGVVKRRNLTDSLIVGDGEDGDKKFSLGKYIRSLGVETKGAKAVEMIAGDEVIGRVNAKQWNTFENDAYFVLGRHQHGKVRVHVPADFQAKDEASGDRDALVTAVHLYRNMTPQERPLVAISDATELSAELASNNEKRDDDFDKKAQ